MEPRARHRTIFNGHSEVVQLLLMLLFEFHLDQSGFILALRQDDVIPFVLEFPDFTLMCVFQRLHFLSLQNRIKLIKTVLR